jgi:hypothetical protein
MVVWVDVGIRVGNDHLPSFAGPRIRPKNMMTLTRAELRDFHGIPAHFESLLRSSDGASYKLFLGIE